MKAAALLLLALVGCADTSIKCPIHRVPMTTVLSMQEPVMRGRPKADMGGGRIYRCDFAGGSHDNWTARFHYVWIEYSRDWPEPWK